MKTYLLPSLKLTAVFIISCSVIYPLLITGIGNFTIGGGKGRVIKLNGKVVGYENIGQKFTADNYFWSRPSAVSYNAAGSAGSNKGPSNPDYLLTVKARIDTFLAHNPGIKKEQIPSELVTASGSGLDPDISVQAAKIQVKRIAILRHKTENQLISIIDKLTVSPLFGFLGPEKVNVLKLNVALDELK